MKMQTAIAITAAVLLCGATAASAADAATTHSSMATPASSVNLTSSQQKTAWNDMKSAATQKAPSGFTAMQGATVPNSVKLSAIPAKTTRDLPSLRSYDFAKINGKLLIVNPHSKTVADVITG